MTGQPEDPSYFEVYWAKRFSPAGFARRVRSLHKNYARHLPASREARIVEIGPGFGEMLQYLADHGYTSVSALDNDPAVVSALRQRGLHGVLHVQDAIAYLRERPATWDCAIGLHVLEHFDADGAHALLRAMHTALVPGGCAILEVPNMANFITAPYARWADHTHRHGYTTESLIATVGAAGFTVRTCFGLRRAVGSLADLATLVTQGCTNAIAWTLLKANYPRSRLVVAPAIAVVAVKPSGGDRS